MAFRILISTVLILVTHAAYDENLARNILAELAGAGYSETPDVCAGHVLKNSSDLKITTVPCDTISDTCSGFTVASHSDKAIIVVFRGTNSFFQLVAESANALMYTTEAPFGGHVVSYFYDAFNQIWEGGMKDNFEALLKNNPEYKIWITGHSLGGAIASIAAATIVHSKLATGDKITIYTLGQPRTGNHEFVEAFDNMVWVTLRLIG